MPIIVALYLKQDQNSNVLKDTMLNSQNLLELHLKKKKKKIDAGDQLTMLILITTLSCKKWGQVVLVNFSKRCSAARRNQETHINTSG